MADYSGKAYREQGGNSYVVAPGGVLKLGTAVFTVAADGKVIVTGLPTSDPAVAGALWNSTGTVKISAGA